MRRSQALALVTACVAAPLLWASPAVADNGYPPTGPTGGGGGVTTTGGSVAPTFGGGEVTLPRTGTDLQTPAIAAGASIATGAVLLVVYRRRRAGSPH